MLATWEGSSWHLSVHFAKSFSNPPIQLHVSLVAWHLSSPSQRFLGASDRPGVLHTERQKSRFHVPQEPCQLRLSFGDSVVAANNPTRTSDLVIGALSRIMSNNTQIAGKRKRPSKCRFDIRRFSPRFFSSKAWKIHSPAYAAHAHSLTTCQVRHLLPLVVPGWHITLQRDCPTPFPNWNITSGSAGACEALWNKDGWPDSTLRDSVLPSSRASPTRSGTACPDCVPWQGYKAPHRRPLKRVPGNLPC